MLCSPSPATGQRCKAGRVRDEGMSELDFSLPVIWAAIIAGALSFILDFDQVERSVRTGLPRRYAWLCAFGLLVGLIFLYWQILRLLSYLRR